MNRFLYSTAILALLAACGGGGGGGSTAAPVASGPVIVAGPFAANASVTNAASDGSISFDERDTSISPIDGSLGGIFQGGSPNTDTTVTMSTDGSGNIKDITVNSSNVPGLSGMVTPVAAGTLTGDSIAASVGSGQSLLAEKLSYSAYGLWSFTDAQNGGGTQAGVFVVGQDTPASVMSTLKGQATYAGNAVGLGSMPGGAFALTGTANLQANFDTQNIAAQFNLTGTDLANNHACASASCSFSLITPSLTAANAGAISGSKFSASLSGNGTNGAVSGGFFGPAANEASGTFQSSSGTTSLVGSFGAKKQ